MKTTLLFAAAPFFLALASWGVVPDADAEKALRRAAESGNAHAAYELGRLFARGGDPAGRAVHWYRKAAERGDPDGRRAAADFDASRGPGPRKGRALLDRAKECARAREAADTACAALFVAAAEEGSAEAQCAAGKARLDAAAAADFYDSVHDVARKAPSQARKGAAEGVGWLKASALQGWPEAQYQLGRLMEEGVYVEKEPAGARVWYRRAADQGHQRAWDALDRLEAR